MNNQDLTTRTVKSNSQRQFKEMYESRISRVPPYMPKGGEVYIYVWEKDNEEAKGKS